MICQSIVDHQAGLPHRLENCVSYAGLNLAELSFSMLSRLEELCDETERSRAARFVFQGDRDAYISAHGLCRLLLSEMDPTMAAADWRFEYAELGKPRIANYTASSNILFNLSHSRSRVVCVAAHGLECGVDVEALDRSMHSLPLDYCLAPDEKVQLESCPPDLRGIEFLRLWTLKEAVSKAAGLGMKMPFDEICLDLRGKPNLISVPGRQPQNFQLWQNCGDNFIDSIALIVKNGNSSDYELCEKKILIEQHMSKEKSVCLN